MKRPTNHFEEAVRVVLICLIDHMVVEADWTRVRRELYALPLEATARAVTVDRVNRAQLWAERGADGLAAGEMTVVVKTVCGGI